MPITPTNTVSAATMAANWGPGVRNNSQKWLNKYLNPKRLYNANPQQSQQAWQTGVQDAISTNAYATGMANSDPNQAAANAQQFGVTNYANAGTNKAAKFQAVAQNLATAINASLQAVANLPKGKGANNEARMIAFSRSMAGYKGKIKT